MQTRGSYDMDWAYYSDLQIAANFATPPGGNFSNFMPTGNDPAGVDHMPIQGMRFFSIDVYTDDLVEIDIMVGMTVANVATMVTLFCPAVLQHNTVYDLAPPHDKDGFLVVTGHLMRLQIRNTSGNVVSPFNLVARVWN
jgi:hypothetical protein